MQVASSCGVQNEHQQLHCSVHRRDNAAQHGKIGERDSVGRGLSTCRYIVAHRPIGCIGSCPSCSGRNSSPTFEALGLTAMCFVTARARLSLPYDSAETLCFTMLWARNVISSFVATPPRFPEVPGHATAFVVTPGSQRPSQLQRLGNAASPVVRIQASPMIASLSCVSCHILSVNAATGSLCTRGSNWCQVLSNKRKG